MQDKNFLRRLFDFPFATFVTPTIIRLLYALALVASGAIALVVLVVLRSNVPDLRFSGWSRHRFCLCCMR